MKLGECVRDCIRENKQRKRKRGSMDVIAADLLACFTKHVTFSLVL